jgi:ATP-dependent DNA helicase RecG
MTTLAVTAAFAEPPDHIASALLDLVEDQWFERKSERIGARELANALIGMANADGGWVVVGLHRGEIEGTDRAEKRRNEQMQANIDYCVPPVRAKHRLLECERHDGSSDHLLVFEIDPSDVVHANVKDEVFLRVGDETRRLTYAQRQELLYDKGQASYEARALPQVGFDRLNRTLLEQYTNAVSSPDPDRLLQARGLSQDDQLTVGGCLLFAEYPQEVFPEAFVRVLRYRGRERGAGARQQLISDERLEGPIPLLLLAARTAVQEAQPARRALLETGRFGDVPLIPEDAWLEGLVNAVVHRSYSAAGDHIRVDVFDDRMEISSPGRFPGLVDLSDPLHTIRFARNPRIARVCADLNFGQELGEGIRRMFEEMRHAGLNDPIYRQTSGSVQLTLLSEPVDRALEARLPEHARAITSALREAVRLSTGEVAEILDVSRPIAQRELGVLRDAGVIQWIGKSPRDPRAYWQLKTG